MRDHKQIRWDKRLHWIWWRKIGFKLTRLIVKISLLPTSKCCCCHGRCGVYYSYCVHTFFQPMAVETSGMTSELLEKTDTHPINGNKANRLDNAKKFVTPSVINYFFQIKMMPISTIISMTVSLWCISSISEKKKKNSTSISYNMWSAIMQLWVDLLLSSGVDMFVCSASLPLPLNSQLGMLRNVGNGSCQQVSV